MHLPRYPSRRAISVMKPIAQLDVNLSRLGKVRPAECVAVVQQESLVRHVHGLQRDQPVFAKAFAKGKIKGRVAGQMFRPIAVEKTRAVKDVSGNITVRGEIDCKAGAKRVALIVIEEEEIRGRREVRKPAGNCALPLNALV